VGILPPFGIDKGLPLRMKTRSGATTLVHH
jgi:hypothetical protein